MKTLDLPARVKPLLRGVSHQVAALVALVAGGLLFAGAAPANRLAVAVYTLCLCGLFSISAAYHRPHWQPAARAWMRRLDHAGIFLLIAGTYTPICLLGIGGDEGERLLAWVWGGAAIGIVKSLVWAHAPKPLTALLCLVLGWAIIAGWAPLSGALGPGGIGLLLVGGGCYTVGALIYAAKRPDPWPAVFGYHEIFHALVVIAAGLHFEMVRRLL